MGEELAGHRFVDDGDARAIGSEIVGEEAAGDERDVQRRKETRGNHRLIGLRLPARLGRGPAHDKDRVGTAEVGDGHGRGQRGLLDARQRGQALLQQLVEAAAGPVVVAVVRE